MRIYNTTNKENCQVGVSLRGNEEIGRNSGLPNAADTRRLIRVGGVPGGTPLFLFLLRFLLLLAYQNYVESKWVSCRGGVNHGDTASEGISREFSPFT